ncbi:MAG: hypothetical protein JSU92_13795 [Deltaproteobacteria bacterium]|nr:MAG: hypothetical protein JSU92_13795 [Deltaproteobacteria bacterium]
MTPKKRFLFSLFTSLVFLIILSFGQNAQALQEGDCLDSDTVVVTGSVSDDSGIQSVTVTLNGNTPGQFSFTAGSWSATFTTPQVNEGANTLMVAATDDCGGGNYSSTTLGFMVDTIDPVVTITNPTNGATIRNPILIVKVTVSDQLTSSGIVSVFVNAVTATFGGGEWSATLSYPTDLSLGANTLTATATDCAGRTGEDEITVYLDLTPWITIAEPADGSTSGTGGFPYLANITTSTVISGNHFVVAEIPFAATFTDHSGTGIDPLSFTVTVNSQDGAGPTSQTQIAKSNGITVTGVSGLLRISLPVDTGSDGLAAGVIITASIDDNDGTTPTGQDTSTITAQLAHISIPEVTVSTATVSVPVNLFVDSTTPVLVDGVTVEGFGGYDLVISWNQAAATLLSLEGSKAGSFYSENLSTLPRSPDDPEGDGTVTVSGGTTRFNGAVKFTSATEPGGFFNAANLIFAVTGTTDINIDIYNSDPTSFVDKRNVSIPDNRKQKGRLVVSP